jgi:hypothetical protein
MDPTELVDSLEPDEPLFDMLQDVDVMAGIRAFLDKQQPYFDVELLSPDQSHSLWVRVTPTLYRANGDFPNNWIIEDGMCQRLDDDRVQPVGPMGSCNGYFISEVGSDGHTVGKLNFDFPS